jgi:purine-nucleoside phosphorylase
MTEQRKKIETSVDFIKNEIPKNFKPSIAVITDIGIPLPAGFKVTGKVPVSDTDRSGDFIFGKFSGKDVIIIKGRLHFYDGFSMRDIAHYIYVLKYIGVKKIISIDEVAHLNPRFNCGELALVYDHINLTGDNPLIGENDEKLGIRFPDMSNAYDKDLFDKVYKIFQDKKVKTNDSVYIGSIGPETETEAEARFYRDIGGDVAGYSFIPENIASVHSETKFLGIGLITREIVADKMAESVIPEEEMEKSKTINLKKAIMELNKIYGELLKKL